MNIDVFPTLFIAITAYYLALYALGKRARPHNCGGQGEFGLVILVAALNEKLVIGETLAGMAALPEWAHVVLIDDGSDDGTAEAAAPFLGHRAHLYRRALPHARRGKGEALNAGLAYARRHIPEWFPGLTADRVAIGVTDADCMYRPGTVQQAMDLLAQRPAFSGVQVPVSIRGASSNLWLLVQDMEFMGFYFMTQRARHWFGSVGMGGNGQFIRLAALNEIGERPWSNCLTEDIDIAMALISRGRRLAFSPVGGVVQHGLIRAARLLRQRTRWVFGHYQVWRRIPALLKAPVGLSTKLDAIAYLLFIVTPMLVLADYVVGALSLAGVIRTSSVMLTWLYGLSPHAVPVFIAGVAFTTQALVLSEYMRHGGARVPWYTVPGLAVIFAAYSTLIWSAATFCAAWKAVRRDMSWAKTQRDPAAGQAA